MSIKILVADDSITIQKVIGIIFGGDDYALTIVDNGKAAVEKAREINPDILLIDALMPGMSGYEVCEHVRATPELVNKPILLLTGSFEPFDENKATACGADAFIAKPFESQTIIAKVKELCELGASRAFQTTAPTPVPEVIPEVIPEAIPATPPPLPIEETVAVESEPAATSAEDIWGAFTPVEEPVAEAPPVQEVAPVAVEPDVFEIVTEEPAAPQPEVAPETAQDQVGGQWIPSDEQTYVFEEETTSELPVSALSDAAPAAPSEFEMVQPTEPPALEEDIMEFEDLPPEFSAEFEAAEDEPVVEPVVETVVPVVAEPVAVVEEAPVAVCPVASAAAPVTLSEDQLRAALASVSKEVIERIVWEVVPDLAETLIKEAIRKIKEGQ